MSPGPCCGQPPAVAKKTKGGYTRQRRGCLTCRQRKKKCDQASPLCGHCLRLNLVCEREAPRELPKSAAWVKDTVDAAEVVALPPSSSLGPSSYPSKHGGEAQAFSICEPLGFLAPEAVRDQALSASRRSMMRYYTSTLANMLSATWQNNCFLSVLLPMAFDCPLLLDAMSAQSSAHLALRYPDFHVASLQHRGRVLANLSAAMQGNSLSGDILLAVALTMCSSETISNATSSAWAHHLAGAAVALQSKVAPTPPRPAQADAAWLRSFEGKWLLRNFAYHDVLMSVSLNRRPLLTGDYWASEDDAMADPYCAFASRIIYLTSEISILNADCAEQGQSCGDASHGSFLQRAHDIATHLRDWECSRAVSDDAPLALLSETYRSAALIYLGQVIRKNFPEGVAKVLPEGILTHVAAICEAALRVPEASSEECSLLFPLFIAGGEAEAASHRQVVRDRLVSMNKWRGFRNVDACREVLEEVWAQEPQDVQGEQTLRMDWRDVVESRGWQLALS